MMHRRTRLKITDVNPHLICILCGGYLIDATTMIECLHSYCRACIVAYLRQSRQCPICDTVVHKTRPLLNIRSDKTLQNLVYKLVPNLFKDEMKRRREFYAKHPQASTSMQSPNAREERGEVCEDSLVIYTDDEHISLSLDYYFPQSRKNDKATPNGGGHGNKMPHGNTNGVPRDVVEKRYLRCPAAVCVTHIKKFIRNKFGLSTAYRIEIVHQNGEDEPLRDDYTLMDIAYIYTWRRNGPLPLLFRVFEPLCNKRKGSHSSESSSGSVPAKVPRSNPSPSAPVPAKVPRSNPSPSAPRDPASAPGTSKPPPGADDRAKTAQQTGQVRAPADAPAAPSPAPKRTAAPPDKPGPSGRSAAADGQAPRQKSSPHNVKTEPAWMTSERHKASVGSALTAKTAPAKTTRKTIIIVTSAKSASTSSISVPNAGSGGTMASAPVVTKPSGFVRDGLTVNGAKSSPPVADTPAASLDEVRPSECRSAASSQPTGAPKKPDSTRASPPQPRAAASATPVMTSSNPEPMTSQAEPVAADATPASGASVSVATATPAVTLAASSAAAPKAAPESFEAGLSSSSAAVSEEKTETMAQAVIASQPHGGDTRKTSPASTVGKGTDASHEDAAPAAKTHPPDTAAPEPSPATDHVVGQTTPPNSNTARDQPTGAPASDDVIMDSPVLLQT